MHSISFNVGGGRYVVEVLCTVCGCDLNVYFGGGEVYHIGSCALAIPRTSLPGSEECSASASVLCAAGHKEDLMVRDTALRLSSRFHCRVCTTAGIHIDHATPEEISILLENVNIALKKLEKSLLLYLEEESNFEF